MTTIQVPTRDQVSPANQALFDQLKKGLGMVPNLYATLALSLPALSGLALGFVLRKPESRLARFIDGMRHRKEQMVALAGYVVAAMLIVLGLLSII